MLISYILKTFWVLLLSINLVLVLWKGSFVGKRSKIWMTSLLCIFFVFLEGETSDNFWRSRALCFKFKYVFLKSWFMWCIGALREMRKFLLDFLDKVGLVGESGECWLFGFFTLFLLAWLGGSLYTPCVLWIPPFGTLFKLYSLGKTRSNSVSRVFV